MRDGVPTLAEFLAAHGYDTAGFVANLDYCGRETGLARGFAHYEDFPLSVFDIFTRYVALGRRIDVSSWVSYLDLLVEKHTGRWYDLILARTRARQERGCDQRRVSEMVGKAAQDRAAVFRVPQLQRRA